MKILVIQNRMGIGDMIMFLPFIKAISNYYGEQVSLMVKKSTKASEYLNEEEYIKENRINSSIKLDSIHKLLIIILENQKKIMNKLEL